ncbi:BZ3500_MvSof-1268-A1-R1_Chr1-2g01338 [Microbotryum saponariae]|uniref:BQ5605_C003g01866 protein n=2 Tax=Microbotryum TaxID=34416 RepID=A0A2X0NXD8_9BASI|nr:BZ3500_MvSof-1268-A1-R1_Chr1-2g01338 [Microbotryum saponariae]SCZ97140.1 BZ3501_MvSof-1269-A2-R1_Chr1-2g00937 [Microbotryum saponariae]SGY37706.1 BQ5605_C003g01866 [Microbotryum silenes-dioicae]
MPASKKDIRKNEQKKKEALGIKLDTTAGGVLKKAPKAMLTCTVCKQQLVASMPIMLRDHAVNKHPKQTPNECFPGATIAA